MPETGHGVPEPVPLALDVAAATGTVNTAVAPISWSDVQASGSTWAKRLGVGRSRRGYRLTFRNAR